MLSTVHLDFETRSAVDLKRRGMYRYAEDLSTEILCMSFRFEGQNSAPYEWRPSMCVIDHIGMNRLSHHVEQGGKLVAHNAGFERNIWNKILVPRYLPWWPLLRIEQQDCTMARASSVHLPADLAKLSAVLRCATTKDDEGYRLMLKMCKPRRINADGTYEWWPGDIDRLMQYCSADVLAEEGADQRLPALSADERELWELDQRINDRGFRLDIPLIVRLLALAEESQKRANRTMWELTNGAVGTCNQTAKIVEWLKTRGIETASIGKGEYDKLVDLSSIFGDATAESVIRLRNETVKASTAKLKTALKAVCSDGRARGMIRFCGAAATRRWSGSLYQPHNLPRVDEEKELPTVLELFDIANTWPTQEAHAMTTALIGQPMPWISKGLRGTIVAEPGNKLIGGDFANVEGRFNAWLSDQTWKLDAFRAFDAKTGPDLYRVAYAESFGVPIEDVKGALRQIGKVQELALGYQGGVGAFMSMGANYGVKPDLIRAAIIEAVRDTEDWERASVQYENAPARFKLSRDQWICLRIVVNKWRKRNDGITQSWWDLQDAAVKAMENEHTIVPVCGGRVNYLYNAGCLWYQLPTGGVLCYQAPRLVERKEARFVDEDGELIEDLDEEAIALGILMGEIHVEEQRTKVSVAFEGTNQKTRQWGTQYLYGGLQSNNVVQGSCRDLLAMGLKRCEKGGYPIVLHVHDEGVAEVAEAFGSPEHFADLLAIRLPGFENFPLVAKAWSDTRYVK